MHSLVLDFNRLTKEAQDWGNSYSVDVTSIYTAMADDGVTIVQIILKMQDGNEYVSTGTDSLGVNCEYIQFASIYCPESTPRFFIKGL